MQIWVSVENGSEGVGDGIDGIHAGHLAVATSEASIAQFSAPTS